MPTGLPVSSEGNVCCVAVDVNVEGAVSGKSVERSLSQKPECWPVAGSVGHRALRFLHLPVQARAYHMVTAGRFTMGPDVLQMKRGPKWGPPSS